MELGRMPETPAQFAAVVWLAANSRVL